MCEKEMTVDETTPETLPDATAESQPEEDKNCVENASSAEAEETDDQQLRLDMSIDDDVDKTEPEMDASDESDLPEEENLIAPDDEPVEPEQNTLDEMNKTLSDVWQLLNKSVAQNSDQTELFEITHGLPETLSELKELFETHISRNQNQIAMFDKMYREMKDYKENFLLVAIHKPIIRELIQLYDDFTGLESQFEDILNKNDSVSSEGLSEQFKQFQKNMENVRSGLEETLYRMDVTLYEEQNEEQERTLNRKLHKAVGVKPTDDPDKDQQVAKVHKKAFSWRDKVFRPKEVTVYRYEPPKAELEDRTNEHTLNEEGTETDE